MQLNSSVRPAQANMTRTLDRVYASMYVSEVRELAATLSFRLDEIEKARAEWLKHEQIATEQATSDPDEFDVASSMRLSITRAISNP